MESLAFVSSFISISGSRNQLGREKQLRSRIERKRYHVCHRNCQKMIAGNSGSESLGRDTKEHQRVIGIVGKSKTSTEQSVEVDSNAQGSIFGMRANAYWENMGVLPLFFAGFGIVALAIKKVKATGNELRKRSSGASKIATPETSAASEEAEAGLHAFKCGGCGYEMYPARGREFKFFPDSFKCPLCGTPKSEFWDLNDPDDPRNQEPEGGDEDSGNGGGEPRLDGKTVMNREGQGKDEAETTTKNRTGQDPST